MRIDNFETMLVVPISIFGHEMEYEIIAEFEPNYCEGQIEYLELYDCYINSDNPYDYGLLNGMIKDCLTIKLNDKYDNLMEEIEKKYLKHLNDLKAEFELERLISIQEESYGY